MKRTIELPPDLDSRIQDIARQWKEYAGTSYDETVRTLLVLGLDALDRAGGREKAAQRRRQGGGKSEYRRKNPRSPHGAGHDAETTGRTVRDVGR